MDEAANPCRGCLASGRGHVGRGGAASAVRSKAEPWNERIPTYHLEFSLRKIVLFAKPFCFDGQMNF